MEMAATKIKTIFFAVLSLVLVTTSLFPMLAGAAVSTVEDDERRRKLIGFRQCIGDGHLDEDDDNGDKPAENFNDMWDGSDGADYRDEIIVMGLDIDSTNGVQSCATVIRSGLRILEPNIVNQAMADNRIAELLAGTKDFPSGISNADFKRNRDALRDRINAKISELGGETPNPGLTVNRLMPLLTLCYNIEDYSPALNTSDKDFRLTINNKDYSFKFKEDLNDDDHQEPDGWLREHDDFGSSNSMHIGDLPLGFRSRDSIGTALGTSGGAFKNFSDDFYPFGSDQPSFTGDHHGNNGILDCVFIRDHKDLFTNASILSVNTDLDTMIACVDTNNNGRCEEDEALAPSTAGIATAGITGQGQTSATCEVTGNNTASWFLCPIINGASAFADWILESIIVPFLDGIPLDTASDSSMFQVWSSFRIIANIMLVGLLLAIALAQGAGKS